MDLKVSPLESTEFYDSNVTSIGYRNSIFSFSISKIAYSKIAINLIITRRA